MSASGALSTGPGATVVLDQVSKRYGQPPRETVAVEALSLTVPAGEICVLVGPSGCGKTTTLRMVNRLIEPTGGRILINGEDTSAVKPTELRRHIGYVIQQVGLFPHQSIGDNVATVPRLLGWESGRIRARVDELLDLVGLEPERYRTRYPSQLSGGERQRVGVARALAAEPPLMLMDEPFGAVDPIVREHLQTEFLRLHRSIGMTVLLVTHDIDEAIRLGDRVAVFQQGGVLAQYATPATLLSRPANDFVAQFVGSDRALKHLALLTVADALATIEGVSGASDESARPSIDLTLRLDTSLREALALLLQDDHQVACVLDEHGRYVASLTLGAVGDALRGARVADLGPPGS